MLIESANGGVAAAGAKGCEKFADNVEGRVVFLS
jgi:hypothetical protein